MKRQWKLLICLALAAVALSACAGNSGQNEPEVFDQVPQVLGPTDAATPTPEPTNAPEAGDASGQSIFSENPYDVSSDILAQNALNEEGVIDLGLTGEGAENYDAYASAEATVYPYAGSTPIPLDPVDMPSPTPRPALTFSYEAYQANFGSASLTFEAPVGWTVDNAQNEVFTLSEPDAQMKDNQLCVVTLAAVPVTSNYSASNLATEVKQRLDTLSSVDYATWKPSYTAERYLLGSKGVYANYTGKKTDGTETGGRIHYTCVNKVMYSLEIIFPLEYKEDYLSVFAKVRETLKRVQ